MRQTAVGGSQKRLTRCFRELEGATQQHKNLPQSQKYSISREGDLEVATQQQKKSPTIAKVSLFTRGSLLIVRWLHHLRKNDFHQKKVCCSQGGYFYLFLVPTRNTSARENYDPVRDRTILGTKKGKKGRKRAMHSCVFSSLYSGSWRHGRCL